MRIPIIFVLVIVEEISYDRILQLAGNRLTLHHLFLNYTVGLFSSQSSLSNGLMLPR